MGVAPLRCPVRSCFILRRKGAGGQAWSIGAPAVNCFTSYMAHRNDRICVYKVT